MEKIINFIKTAGIYFLGSILAKLVSFFLLPLYTNYLDPAILGEYDFAVTCMSFLAPICFFQIWDAMFRFSFDYEKMADKYKVINNTYFTIIVGFLIYTVIYLLTSRILHFEKAVLVFIYGGLVAVNYLYTYLARVFKKNFLFTASGLANSIVAAVCNIFMIVILGMGLESLYIAAIIGQLMQCVMIEINIKSLRYISFKFVDGAMIKKMIKFSLPLCIATISYWLLSGLTKTIIVNKIGTYENGLYAVTNKFAMLLNMVVSVFQFAWNELAYMSNRDMHRKDMYSIAISYIIQFVTVCASALMIISKLVFPFVIGSAYNEALEYIPIAIFAVAFNAIAGFLGTIYSTEKETFSIFSTTIIAALINCIICPIATEMLQLQGAIGTLALSFAILMIGRIIILKKKMQIYTSFKLFFYFVIMVGTAIFVDKVEKIHLLVLYMIILILLEMWINRKTIYWGICKARGFKEQ